MLVQFKRLAKVHKARSFIPLSAVLFTTNACKIPFHTAVGDEVQRVVLNVSGWQSPMASPLNLGGAGEI